MGDFIKKNNSLQISFDILFIEFLIDVFIKS